MLDHPVAIRCLVSITSTFYVLVFLYESASPSFSLVTFWQKSTFIQKTHALYVDEIDSWSQSQQPIDTANVLKRYIILIIHKMFFNCKTVKLSIVNVKKSSSIYVRFPFWPNLQRAGQIRTLTCPKLPNFNNNKSNQL